MRKLAKDEINLLEIFFFIFLRKNKIFFITILTLIISFSFGLIKQQPTSNTFLIKAQIHPISVFDLSKYYEFNYHVGNINKNLNIYDNNFLKDKKSENSSKYFNQNLINKIINQYDQNNIIQLKEIESMYLYNLLISMLNDKEKLTEIIKKNNLIIKEKFQENELNENEIKELVSSIIVTNFDFLLDKNKSNHSELNFSNIQLKFKDFKVGMKFADLILFYVNQEIRKHIIKEFDNLIIIFNQEKKYNIEDIEFEIENNKDNENILIELKKLKRRIMQSKNLERVIDIFNRTPVFSDNFYAGKFKAYSYEAEAILVNNLKVDIFKFILLGLLLSFIYIILENIFKKTKKLKSHS